MNDDDGYTEAHNKQAQTLHRQVFAPTIMQDKFASIIQTNGMIKTSGMVGLFVEDVKHCL